MTLRTPSSCIDAMLLSSIYIKPDFLPYLREVQPGTGALGVSQSSSDTLSELIDFLAGRRHLSDHPLSQLMIGSNNVISFSYDVGDHTR